MVDFGVYTALVTPFVDGVVSYDCLKKLLDLQISGNVRGVIICGTTGEAPTLSTDEYERIVHFVVKYVSCQIKVFVGVGSYDTKIAVQKTILANKLGVDGMLAVTPYYNKPTQVGLVEYFKQISSATNKPIILYSVPSRCGIEVGIETVSILNKECENICAIKEATDNCARVDAIREATGDDFIILSGNDSMTIPFMSLGASGVVSVASNLFPREMVHMVNCAYERDYNAALMEYRKLYPTINKLFVETNPLPIKFLLQQSGIIRSSGVRSPLGRLSQKSINELSKLSYKW